MFRKKKQPEELPLEQKQIVIENKRKDWIEIKHKNFALRVEENDVWLEYLADNSSIYFKKIFMSPCDLKELYLILQKVFEPKGEISGS